MHGSAFKAQDGNHVGTVELKETVVEDGGVRLAVDEVDDAPGILAHIEALEKQKLSQSWNLDVDIIYWLKLRLKVILILDLILLLYRNDLVLFNRTLKLQEIL